MPSRKEDLAIRWANKSEEEKEIERKKNAERIRLYRAKRGEKKRSEMTPDQLAKARALDRNKKKRKRMRLTDMQKDQVKAKDRERKARKRRQEKTENATEETNQKAKKKLKQLSNNCRIQEKLEIKRTPEDKEDIQIEMADRKWKKRPNMTLNSKLLARIQTRIGMREHRRYGFLREYKQRKRRNYVGLELWTEMPNPISEYFKKVKEVETKDERKEELKRKNRIRVERHRLKVKKMLQAPLSIENYGEKGAYELLREKNIQEFERLKKESGLFD